MNIRSLGIDGAWELTPRIHTDERGGFHEWLRQDELHDRIGHRFEVAQANCSTSRAGVIRGIHYADVPPGQAKYVTCIAGAVLDVIVDLRDGSDTFGQWRSVRLDERNRRIVYIAEGLGHGFMATADATLVYLCSTAYTPSREHGVHPMDQTIGIDWPVTGDDGSTLTAVLSERDTGLPMLVEARSACRLPRMTDYVDGVG